MNLVETTQIDKTEEKSAKNEKEQQQQQQHRIECLAKNFKHVEQQMLLKCDRWKS